MLELQLLSETDGRIGLPLAADTKDRAAEGGKPGMGIPESGALDGAPPSPGISLHSPGMTAGGAIVAG